MKEISMAGSKLILSGWGGYRKPVEYYGKMVLPGISGVNQSSLMRLNLIM